MVVSELRSKPCRDSIGTPSYPEKYEQIQLVKKQILSLNILVSKSNKDFLITPWYLDIIIQARHIRNNNLGIDNKIKKDINKIKQNKITSRMTITV